MFKKKYVTIWLFLLTGLLILSSNTAVLAQTGDPTPVPLPPIEPPIIIEPPIWRMEGLRIDYQRVNVTIENQVATTRIDQLFVNENSGLLEGTYFFPLPKGATVSELTMWIDGVPIESKILRKEEARAIYDAIVRELRDPALLEYVGHEAIQANVFPIPGGESRRIEIEYQQVLPADGGLVHYVYPQSSNLYTNLPLEEQSIRVEVRSQEAIRTLYSPSHRVADFREGDFQATVGYEAFDVTAETDFELYYSVSPEEIGVNLLSYKEPGQDGFFMLLAAPSVAVDPDEVVAKDVIFVLDTSGSMEGEKMAQAKEAVQFVISNLNPQDRFNIIAFSTGVRAYLPQLVPAGDAGDATQFINSIEALGGTNISQSLLEAVSQIDGEQSRPTTIIFLTDGLATEGITDTEELINTVSQETPRNARIFAFGVGDDVDTLLLDSITSSHRGTTSYVRPYERLDEELSSFYTKISTPVLSDISIDYGDIIVEQLYPHELPDLFAGTQLVLVGRYRQGGPAKITLTGDFNGETQTFVYEDNLFQESGGDDFIPRLWATRAIGQLLTQIRLQGEKVELIESVVNLSIRYGIITPYTSYLIEEDDIFSQLGRQEIIEEEFEDAMEEESRSFGADAVSEAVEEAELSTADVAAGSAAFPAATPALNSAGESIITDAEIVAQKAAETVAYVGRKTFVLRDGRWIDTTYDETQRIERVGFASDNYFALLSALPELAPYFAHAEQLLVVAGPDVAYEVVLGEGDAVITLPVGVTGESEVETAPVGVSVTAVAEEATIDDSETTIKPTEEAIGDDQESAAVPTEIASVDSTLSGEGGQQVVETTTPGPGYPTSPAWGIWSVLSALVIVVGIIGALVMRQLRR